MKLANRLDDRCRARRGRGASLALLVGVLACGEPDAPETMPLVPAWLAEPGAPPVRIAGRVVVDGVPRSAAHVSLQHEYGELTTQATRSDGTFDFGVWPAGEYQVTATHPDRVAAWAVASATMQLALAPCEDTVSGVVTDELDQPIAGATVRYLGAVVTTTDARGVYRMCAAPGSALTSTTLDIAAADRATISHDVEVAGTMHRDAILPPAAAVSGRVVGPAGESVAFAYVTMGTSGSISWPARPAHTSVLADGAGRFRITGLAAGRMTFMATGPAVRTPDSLTVDVPPAGLDELVVPTIATSVPRATSYRIQEVGREAGLTGRVTLRGVPIAGAAIFTFDGEHGSSAVSASDGSYALDGFNANAYTLTASSPSAKSPTYRFQRAADDEVGRDFKRLDFELSDRAEVAGVLVDETGMPLPDRAIVFRSPSDGCWTRTDSTGRFRCRALRGGDSYLPLVVADDPEDLEGFPNQSFMDAAIGGELPRVHVPTSDSVIRGLKLAVRVARVAVEGRVVMGGIPVARARVRITPRARRSRDIDPVSPLQKLPTAITDDLGHFRFPGLTPGYYGLQASTPLGSGCADSHGNRAPVEIELVVTTAPPCSRDPDP